MDLAPHSHSLLLKPWIVAICTVRVQNKRTRPLEPFSFAHINWKHETVNSGEFILSTYIRSSINKSLTAGHFGRCFTIKLLLILLRMYVHAQNQFAFINNAATASIYDIMNSAYDVIGHSSYVPMWTQRWVSVYFDLGPKMVCRWQSSWSLQCTQPNML